MGKHPVNLALRFLLELAAIFTFGLWGYRVSEGASGILFAILLPLAFALLWGIFAVPQDPSRSGKTVVKTPGLVRLLLEIFLFTTATYMMFDLGYSVVWWIYGGIVFIHYALSHERVRWLLQQK